MHLSPRLRRFPRAWLWVTVAALVAVAMGLTLVAMVPSWIGSWVRSELVTRLGKRTELPVEVAQFDLQWGKVSLGDVMIGGADGQPHLAFDRIEVGLDGDALWSGRAVVTDVTIDGGRVQGSRAQLEALAARMVRRDPDRPPTERGRLDIIPEQLTLREVRLAIHEPSGHPRDRLVETRMDMVADVSAKSASVTLRDVHVDPGYGPTVTAASVHAEIGAVRDDDEGQWSLRFPLTIELAGVGAPVTEKIAVAGVDGTIELADASISEVALALHGSFAGDSGSIAGDAPKLWSARGRLRRDLSGGALQLDMEAFELRKVPELLEDLPLVDSENATVGGHLAVVFGGGMARVEGDLEVVGLNVQHHTLARQTVRDIGFELQFAAEVDPAARWVQLDHADLRRGGVVLRLRGEVEHPARREGRRYRMHAEVPPVDCQAVLRAIPSELVPSLEGFELAGTFDLEIDADVDYSNLEALRLEGDVGIWNCEPVRVPTHAAVERLAGGFNHRVVMRDGRERSVPMYAASNAFTPLNQISPYMVSAVLTTEDGGFWRHRGFLPSQIQVALRRNLAAGRIELGASTITMQMVKNVLLSHERTLARKLQELFLTWYVERVLTKSRIMEVYLNAIEFGPGIYGVTRAARHYFGKWASDLTPPEAAYLALMLPSPVRRHSHFCKGELSPAFRVKLQRILRIMYERGRLTDLEHEVWKETELLFDPGERGDPSSCLSQGQAILSGTETQRALSGLLGDRAAPIPEADRVDDGPAVVDASEVDAPGRPAMDDLDGETGGAW